MGNQTSRYGEDFNADTERSTFRWLIYFVRGKDCIPGYSRKRNKSEISDEIRLFKRKVIMLTKSQMGYFNPSITVKIEFYKREMGELAEYNNKLVTLYPTYYELHNNLRFNTNKEIISFLNLVYNKIKLGNISQLDYKDVGYSKMDEDYFFRMEPGRFKSIDVLQKFCQEMLIKGSFGERVDHFQREYKLRFLS